jgi:hypothetical protein
VGTLTPLSLRVSALHRRVSVPMKRASSTNRKIKTEEKARKGLFWGPHPIKLKRETA